MFGRYEDGKRLATFHGAQLEDYATTDDQHRVLSMMRMILHWHKISSTNDLNTGEDVNMISLVKDVRIQGRLVW